MNSIDTSGDATLSGGVQLLNAVGRRVFRLRKQRSLSRKELSALSKISMRYLAQLEAGEGNFSLALMDKLSSALNVPLIALLTDHWRNEEQLVEFLQAFEAADSLSRRKALTLLTSGSAALKGKAMRICLLGLRGAGKSTLGRRVAAELNLPFMELNRQIEHAAGMPVGEIIALYGQDGFRRLEAETLEEIVSKQDGLVLAIAGGIVDDTAGFERLLTSCHTIWLKASPQDHMDRVRRQGDLRPMAGNPRAMAQLEDILKARESSYQRADHALDTSGRSVEESLDELRNLLNDGVLFGQPVNQKDACQNGAS